MGNVLDAKIPTWVLRLLLRGASASCPTAASMVAPAHTVTVAAWSCDREKSTQKQQLPCLASRGRDGGCAGQDQAPAPHPGSLGWGAGGREEGKPIFLSNLVFNCERLGIFKAPPLGFV